MKRTLIGALCLSLLAIGCSDQPQQPETEQEPQPATSVETSPTQRDVHETDATGTDEEDFVQKYFEKALAPFKQAKEPVEESQVVQPPIEERVEESRSTLSLDEQIEKTRAAQIAIEKHDVETLRTLKEAVDLRLQPFGNTYVTSCVLANFPEGLRVLKEFNFDFDMRNARNGAPPLLCVAAEGGDFDHLEMARVLLECGASVDAEVKNPEDPSLDGVTPFYLAMSRAIMENDEEAFDVARFLLEHGADPDSSRTHDGGQTMLQTAIFKKNLPAVELLLKHGASVTKARNDGVTALMIAAQDGTPAKIRQAVVANVKVPTFSIFDITLGRPLPIRIEMDVFWSSDVFGVTAEEHAMWTMPRPFRRFKRAKLERTKDSHRIVSVSLSCEVNSESQREEEVQAVQEALENKFELQFQRRKTFSPDIYAVAAWKDGAKIIIRSYPERSYDTWAVELLISVEDKKALALMDYISAQTVETDLDVL